MRDKQRSNEGKGRREGRGIKGTSKRLKVLMDGGRWKKYEQMQCKDPERLCESQWFDSESF